MNKKIEIEGKEYSIDIEKAKSMGLLIEQKTLIEDFDVGDLFKFPCGSNVIIVTNGYRFEPMYNIIGLSDSFEMYSDFGRDGLSYNDMLEWLNKGKAVFVKNLNEDLRKIIENTNEAKDECK